MTVDICWNNLLVDITSIQILPRKIRFLTVIWKLCKIICCSQFFYSYSEVNTTFSEDVWALIFFFIIERGVGRLGLKELSLCHKLKYSNLYILKNWCDKPLIFQIQVIWSNRIHSLKYLRSTTFGFKDIVIRKSEFVAKTQFLSSETYIIYNRI